MVPKLLDPKEDAEGYGPVNLALYDSKYLLPESPASGNIPLFAGHVLLSVG